MDRQTPAHESNQATRLTPFANVPSAHTPLNAQNPAQRQAQLYSLLQPRDFSEPRPDSSSYYAQPPTFLRPNPYRSLPPQSAPSIITRRYSLDRVQSHQQPLELNQPRETTLWEYAAPPQHEAYHQGLRHAPEPVFAQLARQPRSISSHRPLLPHSVLPPSSISPSPRYRPQPVQAGYFPHTFRPSYGSSRWGPDGFSSSSPPADLSRYSPWAAQPTPDYTNTLAPLQPQAQDYGFASSVLKTSINSQHSPHADVHTHYHNPSLSLLNTPQPILGQQTRYPSPSNAAYGRQAPFTGQSMTHIFSPAPQRPVMLGRLEVRAVPSSPRDEAQMHTLAAVTVSAGQRAEQGTMPVGNARNFGESAEETKGEVRHAGRHDTPQKVEEGSEYSKDGAESDEQVGDEAEAAKEVERDTVTAQVRANLKRRREAEEDREDLEEPETKRQTLEEE